MFTCTICGERTDVLLNRKFELSHFYCSEGTKADTCPDCIVTLKQEAEWLERFTKSF